MAAVITCPLVEYFFHSSSNTIDYENCRWKLTIAINFLSLQIFILVCCTSCGQSLVAFEFSPANTNGVLAACAGDHISLTCIHDNDATGITRWIFSSPIDCSQTIDHNPPILTRPCGPFTFQDITEIRPNGLFNSTAVATAASSMTGTTAECRDSSGDVYNQIGTASICIIGKITKKKLFAVTHDH